MRYFMDFTDDGEQRCDLAVTARSYAANDGSTATHTVSNQEVAGVVNAAVAVTVVAAAGTYTRPSGSWITDGFVVGMGVLPDGFTNAGNEAKKIISAVTALVITVTDITGLVDEAGSGDETLQALEPGAYYIDATFDTHTRVHWNAGVDLIGDARHKVRDYGPAVPERDEGVLAAVASGTTYFR